MASGALPAALASSFALNRFQKNSSIDFIFALTFFLINRFGRDFFQNYTNFHGGHDGTVFRSIGTSTPATNFKYWFFAGFNVFGGSYCLRSAFLFYTQIYVFCVYYIHKLRFQAGRRYRALCRKHKNN